MFGIGKGKKIERLVNVIGDIFSGQMLIMTISSEELISLSKNDELIAGYLMGFQLHIINESEFKEKDHRGILIDSYYNLFGTDDAQEVIDFAYSKHSDETFKSGITLGITDILEYSVDSKNSPLGLLRILNEREADDLPF